MVKNKQIVHFMLNSADSLDDAVKSLEEDKSIEILQPLKNNTFIFLVELDENFETIFKVQEKIENLFPPDVPYSLDYYFNKVIPLEADKGEKEISLFGHSNHEKVNNYKLTQYFQNGYLYDSKPDDRTIYKLKRRFRGKFMSLMNYLTDIETATLKQGMYARFKMTFNDFESISKEEFENIFNAIKNLKRVCCIGKIAGGLKFIAYIEDPSYDHILNKEIAENMFYKYDDIIKPQILEFGHDLIEGIKNKVNCDYKLTFATTNTGSFETMAGGVIIVKNDADRPYIDICCCPKNNLKIDETVIDDETKKFEKYYHKALIG